LLSAEGKELTRRHKDITARRVKTLSRVEVLKNAL